ncbi:MAG: hypothetical protein P4L28_08590 [Paludibacteraceae bacterium]|nr:hypothetical protein [Paludibacteraceae bacterium]
MGRRICYIELLINLARVSNLNWVKRTLILPKKSRKKIPRNYLKNYPDNYPRNYPRNARKNIKITRKNPKRTINTREQVGNILRAACCQYFDYKILTVVGRGYSDGVGHFGVSKMEKSP